MEIPSTPNSGGGGDKNSTYIDVKGIRYKLGQVIGEGTYSKVHLAYHNVGEKTNVAACKIINKKQPESDFARKFLPRELRIIRAICHPNIVKTLNLAEDRLHVYVFMEYCSNGDLLEYIRARGSISEKRSKVIFRQIVLAVEYLHDMDVAHRDLKCENILLNKRNVVKLADFGFSRVCDKTKRGELILSNTFCGSAAYAAPEILQGESYDPKMYDIWSMGCILYIMLTAEMPFDETDLPRMLIQQQNKSIVYILTRNTKLSASVKLLLRDLLEPNVKKRLIIEQVVFSNWLMANHPNECVNEFCYNIRTI